MKINSFLGVLELRVGIFLMSTVFMICGSYSFFVNLVEWYNDPKKLSGICIVCFTVFLIWIWTCASYGAFQANYSDGSPKLIFHALCQWTAFVILWIAAFFLSKNSYMNKFVCMKGNCPESLWLYNNTWNVQMYGNEGDGLRFMEMQVGIKNLNKPEEEKMSKSEVLTPYFDDIELINKPESLFLESVKHENIDVNEIIVIFSVAYYLVMFIYGWIVLYCYYIEIKPRPICVPKDENQTGVIQDASCIIGC